jgi:hypothetical protein
VAIAMLTRQWREHPGWTAQLHLDNLRAARIDSPDLLPELTCCLT